MELSVAQSYMLHYTRMRWTPPLEFMGLPLTSPDE